MAAENAGLRSTFNLNGKVKGAQLKLAATKSKARVPKCVLLPRDRIYRGNQEFGLDLDASRIYSEVLASARTRAKTETRQIYRLAVPRVPGEMLEHGRIDDRSRRPITVWKFPRVCEIQI